MNILKKWSIFDLFRKKPSKNLHSLIGKIGIVESDLQPSGTVLIDNKIYEVKTDGEYIETGRGVKVTGIRGKSIYVKRV